MRSPSSAQPLWLFGFLNFGVLSAIPISVPLMPREAGLAEEPAITSVTASLLIPAVLYFLWAPMVDVWLWWKHWIALLSVVSAALSAAAFYQPLPSRMSSFVSLLIIATIVGWPITDEGMPC